MSPTSAKENYCVIRHGLFWGFQIDCSSPSGRWCNRSSQEEFTQYAGIHRTHVSSTVVGKVTLEIFGAC